MLHRQPEHHRDFLSAAMVLVALAFGISLAMQLLWLRLETGAAWSILSWLGAG